MNSANSGFIYTAIGALAVAIVGLGYLYYQDQHKTASLEITVDDSGVTVDDE